MQYVYLVTLIFTISAPVFFRILLPKFKKDTVPISAFMGITIIAVYKIVWDILFVNWGIWGFNSRFTLPFRIAGLPVEEYLFFFLIPYASLHLYIVVEKYKLPVLSESTARLVTKALCIFSIICAMIFNTKIYSVFIFLTASALLLLLLKLKYSKLRLFYTSFLLIIVPFILVNGVLTGMFNPYGAPVVWYNEMHIIGLRVGSIPIEDFLYACVMLLGATALYEKSAQIKKVVK